MGGVEFCFGPNHGKQLNNLFEETAIFFFIFLPFVFWLNLFFLNFLSLLSAVLIIKTYLFFYKVIKKNFKKRAQKFNGLSELVIK